MLQADCGPPFIRLAPNFNKMTHSAEWADFISTAPDHIRCEGAFTNELLSYPVSIAWAKSSMSGQGRWHNVKMEYGQICHALTQCREGIKDGPMICQGTVKGKRRSIDTMDEMSLVALDLDCGAPFDATVETIKRLGFSAVVYQSYSNGSTGSSVAKSKIDRWRSNKSDIVRLEDLKLYLKECTNLAPHIIESVGTIELITSDGMRKIHYSHAPLEKFRVISPLSASLLISNYKNPREANHVWGRIIRNFSTIVGVHADKSCTDTSRGFYLPSHAPGAPTPKVAILGGIPINFTDLYSAPKTPTVGPIRSARNSPPKAVRKPSAEKASRAISPQLRQWALKYAFRFKICSALLQHSPDLLTTPAKQGRGMHFDCCPFSENHSNPGKSDSASYVCDATSGRGFEIRCMHEGCLQVDRLAFLERLLTANALPVAALFSSQFLTQQ